MSFVADNLINRLATLSAHDADAIPHGVVKVDDSGKIQVYNRWEQEMAGIAADAAVGKNFFTEIAPCTNNRLVFGKFKDGVASGKLDQELSYTFTYKMKPTNVKLRLFRDASSATNWVFVAKA